MTDQSKSRRSDRTADATADARRVWDFIHRLAMHHAMWYAEVVHQLGRDKAQDILKTVYEKSTGLQVRKLSKTLGIQIEEAGPIPILKLPKQTLESLKETLAVNWLANDGIWFQAVEFNRGMGDAKRCNDSCWAQFSPFEAWSIRRFLDLPDRPGLDGLKQALKFRLYAFINKQSFEEEAGSSFVFRMNDCRVQSARKRKGLPDFPCKPVGVVEYGNFASTIDPRFHTRCIACPPDDHPEEYWCAWEFTLDEKSS